MKVCFYVTSLAMGGAELQCCKIAAAIKRLHGYEVEVLVNKLDNASERLKRILDVAQVPIRCYSWKSMSGLLHIFRLFKSLRNDGVLICYNTFPDFIGGMLGRVAGVPKIYGSVRTTNLPLFHIFLDWVAQRLFLRQTIFNSYCAYEKFINQYYFLPQKSIVISNLIEDTIDVHNYSIQGKQIKVISVGVFKDAKDFPTWLKVINTVYQQCPQIVGTIVGFGVLQDKIKQWIGELGLNKVVSIVDGRNNANVARLLAQADIYLSTSISEGTSNSILEALRSALPVVATNVGDNNRLVMDGESGYIREVGDVDSLARAVLTLCQNTGMRAEMGTRGRGYVLANHGEEKILNLYIDIIREGPKI